jgi:aryl carrier-like protein
VERVPVDRGFLELGCNSIQLVELMGRLQKGSSHQITIADLFGHPTVQSLASFLNGRAEDGGDEAVTRASLRIRLRSTRVG